MRRAVRDSLRVLLLSCIAALSLSAQVHKDIHFLPLAEGRIAILDETHEPYFSQLQAREVSAFINEEILIQDIDSLRNYARERFSDAVIEFSDEEKAYLTLVISEIKRVFEAEGLRKFSSHPWKLIKIEDWLCGGFAHTRGDYIILSQRHLDHLSKDYLSDTFSLVQKLGGLLVHEQMHSLQRNYTSIFDHLYVDEWGFVKGEVESDSSITLNQVSNPDAPIANFLVDIKDGSYYWVRTLLRETMGVPRMGRDFTNKVYKVMSSSSGFVIERDSKNELVSVEMEALDTHVLSFPEVAQRGIDHPNEISAYMFSEYFQSLHKGSEPFSGVSHKAKRKSEMLIKWAQEYMK